VLSALGFLTVVGGARTPDRRTMQWFPVVGLAIGAAVAGVWWLAEQWWPIAVAVAIVVAFELALTGAIHVDGLADSADGLLPHLPPERRLEVMRAPDIGAFALVTVTVVVLLRWAAWTGIDAPHLVVAPIWMLSRTGMAVIPAVVPYARASGLASGFLGGASRWLALWAVPALALLVVADGWRGLVAGVVVIVVMAAVAALAHRRIGGFTGDVLGAAAVLGETAALVALAAQP
jgi:adenosylcobinamide-GDP ribazoletransferase